MKVRKIISIFACVLAVASVLTLSSCKKKNAVVINGIADLDGKKIGVQTGTTGEMWVEENLPGAKMSSFKSGIDAALDLMNGSIDAVVLDELPAQEIVARNPKLAIVRDPYFAENKEEYAIAVKKGNADLLNAINNTIATMKENGEYEALVAAFMPADGAIVIPESVVTDSQRVLKLGTNATFPPFEYVEGDIVGFDISMGEKIAATAKAKLEVVDMAFDSLIPALQSGVIDFIAAGMSVTEERKQNVDFSDSYFASEQVIIIKK
ncbi:MAG: transporter substrate-binding domain-containing protein [Treponemataceae bacterium]|nr:transporter substrate-binding domain-containing protein [Spirochaetales bacterium]MDY6030672.1 transporter substrate-binding domain-containing protein [Treponemataceae bacterium]